MSLATHLGGPINKRKFQPNWQRILPWLAITVLFIVVALLERSQGRLWICSCGRILLWAGDVWSSDNSQHWLDPYSFTHILHGVLFFWLIVGLLPRLPFAWQLCLAILIEGAWEVVENSAAIIDRYRAVTVSLGYTGDTIVNSLADIVICGLGFWLARQLGWRRTLVIFIVIEVVLLVWIRDGLLLNLLMLIYPIDVVRTWQSVH